MMGPPPLLLLLPPPPLLLLLPPPLLLLPLLWSAASIVAMLLWSAASIVAMLLWSAASIVAMLLGMQHGFVYDRCNMTTLTSSIQRESKVVADLHGSLKVSDSHPLSILQPLDIGNTLGGEFEYVLV
jgi:hypothetical protein